MDVDSLCGLVKEALSTPHGTLGTCVMPTLGGSHRMWTFNSTRYIRNLTVKMIEALLADLSTPHGTLGTDEAFPQWLGLWWFTFNSTRYIRNQFH